MISTNTPNYKIKDLEELMILDYPLLLKTLTESELLETKATIYVNKYKNENDLKKIYDALIRGTNAFLETYNLNNPKEQIREITVGLNRNALSEYLTDEKHPKTKTYQALYFGRYSIENDYHYNGDWESGQRLILKK